MPSKRRSEAPVRSGPAVRSAPSRRREALVLAAIGAPILLAVILGTVFLGGSRPGGVVAGGSTPPLPSASTPVSEVPLAYPDSPTKGPAEAPVTLVEFLDPECESCRAAYPLVEQLLSEYEGRIRYVVRYVPLHTNSALAAAALEEAGRQGRYWEMLEILFERQPDWGDQSSPQTDAFLAYGAEIGLDVNRLKTALENPDLSKVERDRADATALGIRGTPTFFVNGTQLDNLSEEGLRTMIEAALTP